MLCFQTLRLFLHERWGSNHPNLEVIVAGLEASWNVLRHIPTLVALLDKGLTSCCETSTAMSHDAEILEASENAVQATVWAWLKANVGQVCSLSAKHSIGFICTNLLGSQSSSGGWTAKTCCNELPARSNFLKPFQLSRPITCFCCEQILVSPLPPPHWQRSGWHEATPGCFSVRFFSFPKFQLHEPV